MAYIPAVTRPAHEVSEVLSLAAQGLSDYEIARQTGVPRPTVQRWRVLGAPGCGRPSDGEDLCGRCGQSAHRVGELHGGAYAYLLGQYLGDGTIYATGRNAEGFALRVSTDSRYPRIIRECCVAIGQIRGRRPGMREHRDRRMVDIVSGWKGWPCLLPQHGPGRKHSRTIALADWQQEIVNAYPGPFMRGLVHSDGWRGTNRVRAKGRDYAYPRYQFSNRSADIRRIFTDACDLLGVEWRPWGRYHVSIAKRDSVALLDEFVGPKA
jgi:hypothetical protein